MKYISVIAGIFGGELLIKNYVEKHYTEKTEKKMMQGHIILRKYHNQGACLNLGAKWPPLVAALSVLLTIVTLIVFVCSFGQRGNALLKTGLSFLLGGAFSNSFDRVKRKYVVDYFSFRTGFKPLDRVVFNLADFAILLGALTAAMASSAR